MVENCNPTENGFSSKLRFFPVRFSFSTTVFCWAAETTVSLAFLRFRPSIASSKGRAGMLISCFFVEVILVEATTIFSASAVA